MLFSIPIKVFEGGKVPGYKTEGASCLDCYARLDRDFIVIFPNEREYIPLGFALELPDGYEAIVRPRSGLTAKGIDVAIGTIDWDYRGEIKACVINNTPHRIKIHNGDRVCQMQIQHVESFNFVKKDTLSETKRGVKGFGSTGLK